MERKYKFLVYRNSGDGNVYYKRYEVPIFKGMSVLEALFYIQDYYDSSFAFRYACRGAICGSCGITIDKVPLLACRTQVASVKTMKMPSHLPEFNFGNHEDWDSKNEILIEPLPNMSVIKDLVVDMEPFWKFYKDVEPYFSRAWNDNAPESKQSAEQMKTIERYVYCILCGLCWACPVSAKNPKYLGPAQLAKANRFIRDSRFSEKRRESVIARVSKGDGVPACEQFFVCNRVCPKGVLPGIAIKEIRDEYLSK
jgi:succinate dehydrogenase / fumarate reductase iron-sulfur subunit